jgi:hypothetical protein
MNNTTEPTCNPAHQLKLLLSPTNLKNYENNKLYDAWSEILGIPYHRRSAILYSIGQIGKLPKSTELLIKRIYPEDHDDYISWTTSLEKVLNQNNLDNAFVSVKQQVSSDRQGLIRICSQQISNAFTVPVATPQQQESTKELYREVLNVISEVQAASEIDSRLQSYSLRHLEILERAIVDFLVLGASNATSTLETSIGLAAIKPSDLESMKSDSTTKQVIDLLAKFVLLVSVFQGSEYIIERATSVVGMLISGD